MASQLPSWFEKGLAAALADGVVADGVAFLAPLLTKEGWPRFADGVVLTAQEEIAAKKHRRLKIIISFVLFVPSRG